MVSTYACVLLGWLQGVSWVPLSLQNMAQQADVVALMHVNAQRSFWRDGRIYTVYTMQADESYAGPLQENAEIEVETWGGVVEGIGQKVDGALSLNSSAQHVLFLEKNNQGVYRTVGMAQGVFHVSNPFLHHASEVVRPEVVHVAAVRAVPQTPGTLGALIASIRKARSHGHP
jgi:hypothetical protein